MTNYHSLLRKGFSKKEAKKTIEIIKKAKKHKSPRIKFLDTIVYWALLIVAIIGNLVISIILIPFLLAFKKIPLYSTIFVLAIMFGYLFDQLIRQIDHLENKQHIIAWIFIPTFAIMNIHYITSFSNHITETLRLPLSLNSPLLVSTIYTLSFILPYTVHSLVELSKKEGS